MKCHYACRSDDHLLARRRFLGAAAGGLGAAGIGISYSAFQSEGIKDRLVEQMFGRVEQQSGVFGGNKAEQELREKRQAQAQVVVTLMTGGVFILALILCVFYTIALAGGIMMRQFRNYKLCRIACTVALIPILSPLVVVGIPFGIWGLSRLSQADIKNAFSIG